MECWHHLSGKCLKCTSKTKTKTKESSAVAQRLWKLPSFWLQAFHSCAFTGGISTSKALSALSALHFHLAFAPLPIPPPPKKKKKTATTAAVHNDASQVLKGRHAAGQCTEARRSGLVLEAGRRRATASARAAHYSATHAKETLRQRHRNASSACCSHQEPARSRHYIPNSQASRLLPPQNNELQRRSNGCPSCHWPCHKPDQRRLAHCEPGKRRHKRHLPAWFSPHGNSQARLQRVCRIVCQHRQQYRPPLAHKQAAKTG